MSEGNDRGPDLHRPEVQAALNRYWRSNLRIMAILLAVWALASFGCGILWADWLNQYRLPFTGFPLGFWFAQQGSIVAFVLCVLVYCLWMNRVDAIHHRELEELAPGIVEDAPDTERTPAP